MLLAALGALAAWWHYSQGFTLYYGDALSRLAHARRLVDSRSPGLDQLGTVWLPLPHLLMLPFARVDSLWYSGLAGVFPSVGAFVIGGGLLYAAIRRLFRNRSAALAAVLVFSLNPNVLYMQSIPMTEAIMLAVAFALLYCLVWYQQTGSVAALALMGAVSNAGSLTRFEGWLLIPFLTLFVLLVSPRARWGRAFAFGLYASIGPLLWLAHCHYHTGNALDFYNGPDSPRAIYERGLKAGFDRAPGDHDLRVAFRQLRAAIDLCAGLPLVVIGATGVLVALWKRSVWPVLLFVLPVPFYTWSIYSATAPIFVPHLWPNSFYNVRYGLSAMPLLALGAAAVVALLPDRVRLWSAALVVAAAVAPWIAYPRRDAWVCWKESQVNSEARRAWTGEAAAYLREYYRPGQGIFTSFGDLVGIFHQAGIPLRETVHQGNNPLWMASIARPDLFLWQEWAVAIAGDDVSTTLVRASRRGPVYTCVRMISVKGGPVIEIYRRKY